MSATDHKPNSVLFRVVILSATLLAGEASSISPILPDLVKAFPDAGITAIQNFLTIGATAGLVATLLAGALANKVGKRRLTLLAMLIIGLAGLAPMVLIPTGNYGTVLASRVVLGFGMGLLQPLSASMIADFYHGSDRENMLGWQSGLVGLGGAIWATLVGLLMTISWPAAFLIYASGLICMVAFYFVIPEPPAPDLTADGGAKTVWYKLISADVWIAFALTLLLVMAFGALFISMPLSFVTEKNLMPAPAAAGILTVFSLASVVAGLIFGVVVRRIKLWTGAVAAAVLAIGFWMMAAATGLTLAYASVIVAGLGYGFFMPFMITTTNNRANARTSAMATAMIFTGAALGTSISPFYFSAVGSMLGNSSNTMQIAIASGTVAVVAILLGLRYGVMKYKGTDQIAATPADALTTEKA